MSAPFLGGGCKAGFAELSVSHTGEICSNRRISCRFSRRHHATFAHITNELTAIGWPPGQYDQLEGAFYSFSHQGARDQMFLFLTQGCVNRVSIAIGGP